jgi:hypothetical protein
MEGQSRSRAAAEATRADVRKTVATTPGFSTRITPGCSALHRCVARVVTNVGPARPRYDRRGLNAAEGDARQAQKSAKIEAFNAFYKISHCMSQLTSKLPREWREREIVSWSPFCPITIIRDFEI